MPGNEQEKVTSTPPDQFKRNFRLTGSQVEVLHGAMHRGQDALNDAWMLLGGELGFVWTTVNALEPFPDDFKAGWLVEAEVEDVVPADPAFQRWLDRNEYTRDDLFNVSAVEQAFRAGRMQAAQNFIIMGSTPISAPPTPPLVATNAYPTERSPRPLGAKYMSWGGTFVRYWRLGLAACAYALMVITPGWARLHRRLFSYAGYWALRRNARHGYRIKAMEAIKPTPEPKHTDFIVAPFSDQQVKALEAWQQCPWTHPMTCGRCASELPMYAKSYGLYCVSCGWIQVSVPKACLSLPPDPRTFLFPDGQAFKPWR